MVLGSFHEDRKSKIVGHVSWASKNETDAPEVFKTRKNDAEDKRLPLSTMSVVISLTPNVCLLTPTVWVNT